MLMSVIATAASNGAVGTPESLQPTAHDAPTETIALSNRRFMNDSYYKLRRISSGKDGSVTIAPLSQTPSSRLAQRELTSESVPRFSQR